MSIEQRKVFLTKAKVNGNIEFDLIKNKLVLMNLPTIDKYRITAATANRPDLIASIYFGSYNMGWLLHYHNNILDPISEYYVGRIINIPSIDEFYKFYNRNANKV